MQHIKFCYYRVNWVWLRQDVSRPDQQYGYCSRDDLVHLSPRPRSSRRARLFIPSQRLCRNAVCYVCLQDIMHQLTPINELPLPMTSTTPAQDISMVDHYNMHSKSSIFSPALLRGKVIHPTHSQQLLYCLYHCTGICKFTKNTWRHICTRTNWYTLAGLPFTHIYRYTRTHTCTVYLWHHRHRRHVDTHMYIHMQRHRVTEMHTHTTCTHIPTRAHQCTHTFLQCTDWPTPHPENTHTHTHTTYTSNSSASQMWCRTVGRNIGGVKHWVSLYG